MSRLFAALLCFAIVIPVSAKKNPYMMLDSEEYKTTTSKILGSWSAKSYIKGESGEQVGGNYTEVVFEFKAPEKSGKSGVLTYRFSVADSIVQRRSADYRAKEEGMSVSSYAIVGQAQWRLSKSGDILYIDDESFTVDIAGTGKKWLESFIANEKGFIESASAGNSSMTLGGMIGGAVMKSASGVSSYYPSLPSQSNPVYSGSDLELKTISDNKLFFVKK